MLLTSQLFASSSGALASSTSLNASIVSILLTCKLVSEVLGFAAVTVSPSSITTPSTMAVTSTVSFAPPAPSMSPVTLSSTEIATCPKLKVSWRVLPVKLANPLNPTSLAVPRFSVPALVPSISQTLVILDAMSSLFCVLFASISSILLK